MGKTNKTNYKFIWAAAFKAKEEDEPPLQKGQKEKEGKNTHELPSITEQ